MLFAVADKAGNVAVVSVAWVGLTNASKVCKFDSPMRGHGSGGVTPLGGALLDLGRIEFTRLRYGRDGAAIFVAKSRAQLADSSIATPRRHRRGCRLPAVPVTACDLV